MKSGEIYKHAQFYPNAETGELLPKFFLVLALTPADDIVARLLTSRPHGRRETPPCSHGDPYPSYYIGVIGAPLDKKSWLDLRKFDDLDSATINGNTKRGLVTACRDRRRSSAVRSDGVRRERRGYDDATKSIYLGRIV